MLHMVNSSGFALYGRSPSTGEITLTSTSAYRHLPETSVVSPHPDNACFRSARMKLHSISCVVINHSIIHFSAGGRRASFLCY